MVKILVIEDETAIRENILEILEFEGLDVIGAADGVQGVDLARQYLPDMILCDIMMPRLDGYGVLLALRSEIETSLIPFVFLTAKAERRDLRYGMELGADDYLTKPFTHTELLNAINTRLDRQDDISAKLEHKLDALRGSIFYMLPHELRTPLVSIIGYSELLMFDAPTMSPDGVAEMATSIYKAGQRLHHLIENFLIYAQIEIIRTDPGRVQALRSLHIDLPDRAICETAHNTANDMQREPDLVVQEFPQVPVRISEDNLRKIVAELVDNAFKYSGQGTPVCLSGHTENGTYFIQIKDQGRGMTAEQIANIGAGMQFERKLYEQQGTGMGLTIARNLVELHGGTLEIESVPEEQTAVVVRLPLM